MGKRAFYKTVGAGQPLAVADRWSYYCYAFGTCYCLGDLAKYLEDCIVYRPLSEDDLEQDKITYINR